MDQLRLGGLLALELQLVLVDQLIPLDCYQLGLGRLVAHEGPERQRCLEFLVRQLDQLVQQGTILELRWVLVHLLAQQVLLRPGHQQVHEVLATQLETNLVILVILLHQLDHLYLGHLVVQWLLETQ